MIIKKHPRFNFVNDIIYIIIINRILIIINYIVIIELYNYNFNKKKLNMNTS